VRHLGGAAAYVESRAGEFLDAQDLEADAGPDDVYDGIDRADFVEMDLFKRDVVHPGFGFAELLEDGTCAVVDLGCQLRFLQNFQYISQRAMLLLVFGSYPGVGCGHAVLPNFLR
jgi:hypothetical protein